MTEIAQAATDPALQLVNYGAIGILLAITIGALRVLWKRDAANADLQRQRAERAEEELRQLNKATQDRTLVILGEATAAIRQVLAELRGERGER